MSCIIRQSYLRPAGLIHTKKWTSFLASGKVNPGSDPVICRTASAHVPAANTLETRARCRPRRLRRLLLLLLLLRQISPTPRPLPSAEKARAGGWHGYRGKWISIVTRRKLWRASGHSDKSRGQSGHVGWRRSEDSGPTASVMAP
ncbi:hypothetical protein J6590_016494 [Homalodisca vitripennis]|nr:hypothetical protein J6590_016494 [Homalodisca vitripennis]